MPRKRHPIKEIEQAIRYAERHGWSLRAARRSSHCFGILKCPHNDRECHCGVFCQASVWSTPANPQAHARSLQRIVRGCMHETDRDDRV